MKRRLHLMQLASFLMASLLPARDVALLERIGNFAKLRGHEALVLNGERLASGDEEILPKLKQIGVKDFPEQMVLLSIDLPIVENPAIDNELMRLQRELLEAKRVVWFVSPASGLRKHTEYVTVAADPPVGQQLNRFLFTWRGKPYPDARALLEAITAAQVATNPPLPLGDEPTICLIPANLRSEWMLAESEMGKKLTESLRRKAVEKHFTTTLARSNAEAAWGMIWENRYVDPFPPEEM